jgi:uncharacterized protein YjbI with pentapeptide repeats
MTTEQTLITPVLKGDRLLITLRDGEVLSLGPGLVAPGRDFSGCDLSMVKMDGANLDGCRFEGADLTYVDFSNASLVGAEFINCTLNYLIMIRANLQNTLFVIDNDVEGIRFEQADLSFAKFAGSGTYRESYFNEASLFGARFDYVDFNFVRFDGCDMTGCQFYKVVFEDVVLHKSGAVLAMFDSCEFNDVEFFNAVLNGCRFVKCTLGWWGIKLNSADLQNSHFIDCRFGRVGMITGFNAPHVDFRGASFTRSQFILGNFEGAVFTGAQVVSCGFNETEQEDTVWDKATVVNSRFRLCHFKRGTLQGTKFINCSLQEALFVSKEADAAVFDGCDFGPSLPARKDDAA